jgi:acetyl-CoA synthetase
VKGLRIGKRRGRDAEIALSPLELALRPALVDGRWQIPDRFNFTRDVVEALARDPKRRALTFLGSDGVIEPRTFLEISEGATVWAVALREEGVGAGDRVILMGGTTVDWLEALLGIWKTGAVAVPCVPTTTPSQLERLVSSTDATLVAAERSLEPTIERMGFSIDVHLYDSGVKRNSKDVPKDVPTHDTATRDLAFVVSTAGAGGPRKEVAHSHGSVFATRVQAEHWLDVGRGDTVWCTAVSASAHTMWNTVVGPWSRGAEIALQQGEFDVDERLDLMFRLGPSILCQTPAEYRKLAEHPHLERFRSPRLRRLVSTGDFLDPEVVAVFEERWGLSVADGYAQTETNIVVANLADGAATPGSLGRALPGHHVAVIDDQGNELPHGIEGDLAVRGRPPTLFAGYWELPEETKSAFLGDWYLTGDVAHMDEEGTFTFVGRAEDVITSGGRTFGPYDVERVLDGHAAIAATAVVGIRDLQRGGHFVRAFVVPRSPDGGSEQLEAELRQYAAQTLPNHQVPREIVFVEELPTFGWKISRHELRERPLVGRPLWEMPPTTEPESAASKPAPPPLDDEFSPRIDTQAAQPTLPVASVSAPPPVAPEPVVVEPPPLAPPAPVRAEPVPEPPAAPAPALRAAEPAPPTVEAQPTIVDPEPPTVVAEPVEAEPTEPEPLVAHTLREPDPAPEPLPVLEPALEPVAEASPEPEPTHEWEPDPEPEPEPATLAAVPESQPEPEPIEPAHTEAVPSAAPVPELTVIEPERLPDYVIELPAEPPPVVVPEPEPEPDLSGPLPDFLLEPDATEAAAVVRLEPSVEDEEEEVDLGPLPDYVIDPNDPEAAVRKHVPPPPPEPTPILAPRPVEPEEPPVAPALNFPSAAAFTIPRADRDNESRDSRTPRIRPPAEPGKHKRSSNAAEPGDEASEVSWMEGLSNRLSAYSLSEEDEELSASETDDDTVD